MPFVLRIANLSDGHPLKPQADNLGQGYVTGVGADLAADVADAKKFTSENAAREFSIGHEMQPLLAMERV